LAFLKYRDNVTRKATFGLFVDKVCLDPFLEVSSLQQAALQHINLYRKSQWFRGDG
jgi:hypothetical protein